VSPSEHPAAHPRTDMISFSKETKGEENTYLRCEEAFWKDDNRSAGLEIPWPKGHYSVHKFPALGLTLSWIKLVQHLSTLFHHHQWLYSPSASHRRFRNRIKTHGRTPLDEWSACRKGLYVHRTTQHRNTKTNIHASSGIRTHDPSNQAAIGTGSTLFIGNNFNIAFHLPGRTFPLVFWLKFCLHFSSACMQYVLSSSSLISSA
jgi:hypothetical protein